MKIIMSCTKDEYERLPRVYKKAVKAVIRSEDKIGLIHHEKNDLYDFPGGGVEDGETLVDALIREVKEETGATVKPSSVEAFPVSYVLIYKDNEKNIVIERRFDYFTCAVEEDFAKPVLTDWEVETAQKFAFVSINDAIALNETAVQRGFGWVENPTFVLKLLKEPHI
jgi:8-oxo-dGTP pyrophosphatase MutT (NUDIX family)